jgi:hypothetical protein
MSFFTPGAIVISVAYSIFVTCVLLFANPNPKKINTITPCLCGCMTTGKCECENCCERTKDQNYKEGHCCGTKK